MKKKKKKYIHHGTCPYSSLPVFGKIASRARAEVEHAPSERNNCVVLKVFL